MLELSEPTTSKASRLNTLSTNIEDNEIEMEDIEDYDDSSSLWCIEDDTMFFAQGLKHHSTGKGKSVYVTWNENYLLNFVFKTSNKTGATTLTKVRISMPVYDEQLEEIVNMLILEMNTLIYMKSGNVYYFSSVKSMHKVDWLTGVRCMASCSLMQFSVIRLAQTSELEHKQRKILSLQVYRDVPQLGKCISNDNILCHSYDISFDLENIFKCEWLDENYTLTSLITDNKNLTFLKQLASIGNIFRTQEEIVDLKINQELHIFTISGNIFILVGAIVSETESESFNPQVDDYSIRLLNTYACHIECIRIDCEKNLLIVLLQSGHMDIWYKSIRMFGALFHLKHQISHFLDYDYWSNEKIFFFTTPNDIVQLKIITSNDIGAEKECSVLETRKSIGGMVACTWVENLQQLICLSFNNIFYRINFTSQPEAIVYTNETETNYENLISVYALNSKRVKDLTVKAQLVNELMEQPKHIHQAIEKEFQKQQMLTLASKKEIVKKLFHCHIEYHINIPGLGYFDKDCVHIRKTNHMTRRQSIFCLIFLSLKNKSSFITSIFTDTMWYLNISNSEQSLQFHIPFELLNKQLCVIIDIPLKQNVNNSLPKYSVNLLSFLNHNYQHICLKYKLCLHESWKTYLNIFSCNIQNLPIFCNSLNDLESLLKEHSSNHTNKSNETMDCNYKIKQRYKISKNVLHDIMEKLNEKFWSSLDMQFEIFYLHQYLIVLCYDDSNEILQICSNYPIAIFYFKLLLLYVERLFTDRQIDRPQNNVKKMITNYQNDVEHLYASLTSLQSDDVNCNTVSMHLENMQNVYLKLRHEFYNIFR